MRGPRFRLFGGDRRGNVAMVAGLLVPVIAVAAAGGVEIGFLLTDKTKLQAAVDSAALTSAHGLALSNKDGVVERAEALAKSQVQGLTGRSTVTADASIVEEGRAIRVELTANRPSFFGNVLPPGGFTTRAEATAVGMSRTPLCVLVQGHAGQDKATNLLDDARISADGCLVHSNRDIVVEGAAQIVAGAVQSVKNTSGRVSPAAEVGAEPIADPFSGMNLATAKPCGLPLPERVLSKGLHILDSTFAHCEDIEVRADAKLRLKPGVHYFKSADLILNEQSELYGKDVTLVFSRDSKFEFKDSSVIDLYGKKTGVFAGFLIVTSRLNKNDFIMWSNNIRNLLGVVYIPEAKLLIQGTQKVAEQSAWTVIVARELQLKGSPTLVINRNYAVSDVPVPNGVGPKNTEARLSQ